MPPHLHLHSKFLLLVVQPPNHVQFFCHPMNCSPPGSSVCGISQARIQEWVAISFSRGSSQPRDQTHVSCIAGRFFTAEPPGKTSFYLQLPKQAVTLWFPRLCWSLSHAPLSPDSSSLYPRCLSTLPLSPPFHPGLSIRSLQSHCILPSAQHLQSSA